MQREREVLLIYDITDTRTRNRIVDACKDYGLERFQYSAFRGVLTRNKAEELWGRIMEEVEEKRGRVLMVRLCEEDARTLKAWERWDED